MSLLDVIEAWAKLEKRANTIVRHISTMPSQRKIKATTDELLTSLVAEIGAFQAKLKIEREREKEFFRHD